MRSYIVIINRRVQGKHQRQTGRSVIDNGPDRIRSQAGAQDMVRMIYFKPTGDQLQGQPPPFSADDFSARFLWRPHSTIHKKRVWSCAGVVRAIAWKRSCLTSLGLRIDRTIPEEAQPHMSSWSKCVKLFVRGQVEGHHVKRLIYWMDRLGGRGSHY